MLNYIEINKFGRIQTIQAGGQPHSDTSIYKVNECSLNCLTHMWKMGRGGGQVVSLLAFYSVDPSSNPTDIYSFFL